MKDLQSLCAQVRQTAYDIHLYHGHGHLEKVYENALAHRLRKAGLDVKQQYPIKVFDEDGTLIGDYYADLFVDGWLIVELKTAKALAEEHVAQVLGYLKSAVSNTVCSSTSGLISSRCASLPGRKTRPAARASPRSFWPLSLRSLRFNRRRILSCALRAKRNLIWLAPTGNGG